jgi:hypothetical protein
MRHDGTEALVASVFLCAILAAIGRDFAGLERDIMRGPTRGQVLNDPFNNIEA